MRNSSSPNYSPPAPPPSSLSLEIGKRKGKLQSKGLRPYSPLLVHHYCHQERKRQQESKKGSNFLHRSPLLVKPNNHMTRTRQATLVGTKSRRPTPSSSEALGLP